MSKQQSKSDEQHRIWTKAKAQARRKNGHNWSDEDCNGYAYGYLDGWFAAKRKPAKKKAAKKGVR